MGNLEKIDLRIRRREIFERYRGMNEFTELFKKSKALIDNARSSMGVVVNALTVYTSYLLGKYMIEEEQQGSERAQYGVRVLDSLSVYLAVLSLMDRKAP